MTDIPASQSGEAIAPEWLGRIGRPAIHLALLLALLTLWEVGVRAEWLNPLLFPRPTGIANSFVTITVIQGNLWPNLYVTMWEVFVGFLAGSSLGIGLAIAVGLSPLLTRFLKPYVIILEATPRIALAPLIIAALGFGWESKIAIVMLVCFFAPFVNTLSGMLQVEPEKLEMFRSLRASRLQVFFKLMLPDAMPIILAGLRLALAASLSGALVAEFISANEGMGLLLKRYTASLNMSSSFACLLTLTAIGFLLFRSMEAADARIVFWEHPERVDAVSRRRAAAWRKRFGGRS
jgi:NitT/TauT family transport system permease protein